MSHQRAVETATSRQVSEVCAIGDTLRVKVIAIDDQGRVKLSRKAVLVEEGESGNGEGRK